MRRDLNQSAVLLAGASGGLGSALGAALVDRGAQLTLVGRSAERLAAERAARPPGRRGPGRPRHRPAGGRGPPRSLRAPRRDRQRRRRGGVRPVARHRRRHPRPPRGQQPARAVAPAAGRPPPSRRRVRGQPVRRRGRAAARRGWPPTPRPRRASRRPTPPCVASCDGERIDVIDVRPPHTETGLADRPIAGDTPPLPEGLDPAFVADRIVQAIELGRARARVRRLHPRAGLTMVALDATAPAAPGPPDLTTGPGDVT